MGQVMRLYNDRAMAERPGAVLDYGAFQHPPSPLFRDYVAGAPAVRPFYDGGGWDLESLTAAATASSSLPRRRGPLADALVRQQEALGSPRRPARGAGGVLPALGHPRRRLRPPALVAPSRARRPRSLRPRPQVPHASGHEPRAGGGVSHVAAGRTPGRGAARRGLSPAGAGPGGLLEPLPVLRRAAAGARRPERPGGGPGNEPPPGPAGGLTAPPVES